jgi:hypothetical protein
VARGVAGRSGRGARVVEALKEGTGLSSGFNDAVKSADALIEKVRAEKYAPLEQAFPEVRHGTLEKLLAADEWKGHVAAVSKEVATGKRPPSMQELQALRGRLRGLRESAGKKGRSDLVAKARDQLRVLDEAMREAVPGLEEADQAFAAASGSRRALDEGRRFYNRSGADVERRIAQLSPEARQAFNIGRVHEISRRLQQRDKQTPALLRRFMDAGPETKTLLRSMFPDEKTFGEFQRVLRREESAEAAVAALKKYIGYLGAGAAGGAIASQL